MFEQLLAITRNTFFESIRQPIALVILVAASFALVIGNALSAFTMQNDLHMYIDMGLATVFLCGALLASFVATGVLTREIENKTALTVISKPVGRPLFVIGKFLGVAGAMLLATAYMSFVFLLVEMHDVLETVRDPIHVPVIAFGVGAVVLGVAAATWSNYFYGRIFSSTVLVLTTPLVGLAYLFSLMFDAHFAPQPIGTSFKPQLWLGICGLTVAIVVLTAVAVAASARLSQVMTLCVTLGVFLLGLLSDWVIGRPMRAIEGTWLDRAKAEGLTEQVEIFRSFTTWSGEVKTASIAEKIDVPTVTLSDMASGGERVAHGILWTARAIIPDFQVLWYSDAITQEHRIPLDFVGMTVLYGGLYIVVALSLAIILFQRREVG
jgi:ABC-type transport system involved in multi-copper enzyme maturation permease subunit